MYEPEARTDVADTTRWLLIFVALLAMIAVPFWLWKRHEALRPTLSEVRVVAATSGDPVFREGPRVVAAEERVQLAVAMRLTYRDGSSTWISAADRLVLDGQSTDHVVTSRWPEEDREARVFWFTLEAPVVGGRIGPDTLEEKLRYRTFLAPELGNHWLVDGDPEHHADDLVNIGSPAIAVNAGTYRPYVRVEIHSPTRHEDRQAETSLGPSDLDNPRMVRISRQLPVEIGLEPAAGELFRLPGLEPEPGFEAELLELATRRVAASSWTLAAAATTGRVAGKVGELDEVWRSPWPLGGSGAAAPPRWGLRIRRGDLLRQGSHWLVAVSDDGDGVLSDRDRVLHSWGRPAALMPLNTALGDADDPLVLLHRR